jgi:hypothetical protein
VWILWLPGPGRELPRSPTGEPPVSSTFSGETEGHGAQMIWKQAYDDASDPHIILSSGKWIVAPARYNSGW